MTLQIWQGGQSGVDDAAASVVLEIARPDLTLHGWAPHGWMREDEHGHHRRNAIPARYRPYMREHSGGYVARTEANVDAVEAAMLIFRGRLSGGTKLTDDIAGLLNRPTFYALLEGDATDEWLIQAARAWLGETARLLIAGPRESKQPNITEQAKAFLLEVLR